MRFPRPRSLTGLTVFFFLIFLATAFTTAFSTLTAIYWNVETLVDQRITRISFAATEGRQTRDIADVAAHIRFAMQQRETGDIGYLLTDANGRRLAGNVRLPERLAPGYHDLDEADGIPSLTHGRAFVRDLGRGVTLVTLAETEPVEGYHTRRLLIHGLSFLSIIVIVIIGIAVFANIISRRIAEMRGTAEAIIDGDMSQRVPVDGTHSAFDQQAETFNRMLDRIAALMTGIANVSNDVAHDLRTPLARLRSQLALMHKEARDPAAREDLEKALAQSDELLAIFAAILRIAEIEGGDRRAAFQRIDLTDLAAEIVETVEPEPRTLTLASAGPLWVEGDRQLLAQALINLIENALFHTPEGAAVQVRIETQRREAHIIVADNGPGIPRQAHEKALRRFGRIDASRTRPGHGLGLPMVEAIARLHRGTVTLGDAQPGLVVTVALPVRNEASR